MSSRHHVRVSSSPAFFGSSGASADDSHVRFSSLSEGKRGGKTIATKAIVDSALKDCPLVEKVLVLQRTGNEVPMKDGRDFWWHEEAVKVPTYCSPEIMNSEDPLFILYVSRAAGPGRRSFDD